ncbi:MAG: anti-sigma factor antagonist [Planctomycetes bacterium]|nr:anti-sigma factor antagonist [Planctomycetota bacterium]
MPDLAIQVQVVKGLPSTAVVILNGSIDAKTVITFQTHLNSVKERGINRFILDMENVKYVNSTGLGYLINLSDSLGEHQGGITLVKVQPKVKVVFDMLGLNAFFKIYGTRDEALKAFTAAEPVTSPTDQTVVLKVTKQEPERAQAASPAAATAVVERPVVATAPSMRTAPPPPPAEALHIECSSCKALLAVKEAGTYKCPRCFALFNYAGGGRATFLPRRKSVPVQLSLNFSPECTDGLLEFVRRAARRIGFNDGAMDQIDEAVRDTVRTIHRYSYGGNENNIYHVQLLAADSEIELRFADYGTSLEPDRADDSGRALFTGVRSLVDRFELKHHPKGGNFVVVAKSAKKES